MARDDDRRLEIAAFRYRLIADAAEGLSGGVTTAIAKAVKEPHVDLDGSPFTAQERTLLRHLSDYKRDGLLALAPKLRKDRGSIRAIAAELLEHAAKLRREEDTRATKTIIDILVRSGAAKGGQIARSTLDRHFDRLGLARRQRARLGEKTYRKVLTEAPFELVIADFPRSVCPRRRATAHARRRCWPSSITSAATSSRLVTIARRLRRPPLCLPAPHDGLRALQRLYIDNGLSPDGALSRSL